ncbi:MAG: hypothetical protein ACI920_003957, partial [Saprospiraceae bacterium]
RLDPVCRNNRFPFLKPHRGGTMDSIWCRGDAILKIQPHFTTNGVVAMRLENFNKLTLHGI